MEIVVVRKGIVAMVEFSFYVDDDRYVDKYVSLEKRRLDINWLDGAILDSNSPRVLEDTISTDMLDSQGNSVVFEKGTYYDTLYDLDYDAYKILFLVKNIKVPMIFQIHRLSYNSEYYFYLQGEVLLDWCPYKIVMSILNEDEAVLNVISCKEDLTALIEKGVIGKYDKWRLYGNYTKWGLITAIRGSNSYYINRNIGTTKYKVMSKVFLNGKMYSTKPIYSLIKDIVQDNWFNKSYTKKGILDLSDDELYSNPFDKDLLEELLNSDAVSCGNSWYKFSDTEYAYMFVTKNSPLLIERDGFSNHIIGVKFVVEPLIGFNGDTLLYSIKVYAGVKRQFGIIKYFSSFSTSSTKTRTLPFKEIALFANKSNAIKHMGRLIRTEDSCVENLNRGIKVFSGVYLEYIEDFEEKCIFYIACYKDKSLKEKRSLSFTYDKRTGSVIYVGVKEYVDVVSDVFDKFKTIKCLAPIFSPIKKYTYKVSVWNKDLSEQYFEKAEVFGSSYINVLSNSKKELRSVKGKKSVYVLDRYNEEGTIDLVNVFDGNWNIIQEMKERTF